MNSQQRIKCPFCSHIFLCQSSLSKSSPLGDIDWEEKTEEIKEEENSCKIIKCPKCKKKFKAPVQTILLIE
ncbi:MAG: hypothetical protein WC428_05615 [Candidatus Paceibacterota bacterium]|jgi:uncharacterized Zn-finger protein